MRSPMSLLFVQVLLMPVVMFGSMFFITNPQTVHAASAANCRQSSSSFLGLPTWYKYLSPSFEDGECKLNVDFEQSSTYTAILFAILEILLRIAGLVAVAFVVVGGFTFVTSDGQPERAKNARWTIFNALIGLGITLSATVLVNFIGNRIG